jgi:hypothetical protein
VPTRHATLIRTGQRVESCCPALAALYPIACKLCPEGFPAEETKELDALREHVSLALVGTLRREVSAKTGIPLEWLSLDRFTLHGCGPVSLHEDRHNYPGVYFVIVVVHAGRLGVVDATSRARPHEVGEILLLDPHKKHALVPAGLTAREHRYERTHSPVLGDQERFMFVGFDVRRPLLRDWFRPNSVGVRHRVETG